MKNIKIAFIGTGFMGCAIIDGLVSSGTLDGGNIIAVNDAFPDIAAETAEKYGVVCGAGRDIAEADAVLFAVKPQVLPEALEMYGRYLTPEKLYLTIMAGISTSFLEEKLGGARVIRFMPNLALSIGYSATAYCLGKYASADDGKTAEELFAPMGIIKKVRESEISAVTALSGSGPAYFYRLTEAMASAGEKLGMDTDTARRLALQTLIGSAKLIEQNGLAPSEMRQRVTSKGGTTAAALDTMTAEGFDETVLRAMRAAYDRSEELGK